MTTPKIPYLLDRGNVPDKYARRDGVAGTGGSHVQHRVAYAHHRVYATPATPFLLLQEITVWNALYCAAWGSVLAGFVSAVYSRLRATRYARRWQNPGEVV